MNLGNARSLKCVRCHRSFGIDDGRFTCSSCGIEGILDVEYDYDAARTGLADVISRHSRDTSVWRYLPLLPVDPAWPRPALPLETTPLVECPALAKDLGVARYAIKDDSRTATCSSKDRASVVAVVHAQALGFSQAGCASTGNAAVSLAGWCAATGLKSLIFVPATAPEAKVAQLAVYGAQVLLVEGDYSETWELAQNAAEELGFYNRNCAVNPFLVEGKKTLGLELAEQLRDHPATVVSMSVGDGCSIAGLGKGFDEMVRFSVLHESPRLLGVQAEGAAPLAAAFDGGLDEPQPQPAKTLADSIAVGHPRNPIKALRAVRRSQGSIVSVSDDEILRALHDVASRSGIFAEPAAAAPLAGLRRAREAGLVKADDTVVHVVTGSGLKDVKAAMLAAPPPTRVSPSVGAVREVLNGR